MNTWDLFISNFGDVASVTPLPGTVLPTPLTIRDQLRYPRPDHTPYIAPPPEINPL